MIKMIISTTKYNVAKCILIDSSSINIIYCKILNPLQFLKTSKPLTTKIIPLKMLATPKEKRNCGRVNIPRESPCL